MKVIATLAASVVLLGSAAEALAEKQHHEVTKSSPGLSIRAESRGDGTVAFTVARDPKASPYHGRTYVRGADLRVNGPTGPLVRCPIAGTSERSGVEYHFVLAADLVDHSEFVLSEVDRTGADGKQDELLLGGGDIFSVKLKHFPPGPQTEVTRRTGGR